MSTAWLARLFLRRLGGYTGDCLGAVQQAFEVAFYLGLLAVMRHRRCAKTSTAPVMRPMVLS